MPKIRRKLARVTERRGEIDILCPFCHPPHPISQEPSNCGTTLELVAVQQTFSTVTCALCGRSGGTLVQRGGQYVHDNDCTPGHRIYTVPPRRSHIARLLYPLPASFHAWMVRRFGVAPVKFKDGSAAWDRPQVVNRAE